MIYCELCAVANREGSRYCNGCGNLLVEEAPADEPLPSWLRQAAVADYLWKGEMLLPHWLSDLKPFRELYGASAVVLPPPVTEAVDTRPAAGEPPVSDLDAEDLEFVDLGDDEEGREEADLLLIDDLDTTLYVEYGQPGAAASSEPGEEVPVLLSVDSAGEPEIGTPLPPETETSTTPDDVSFIESDTRSLLADDGQGDAILPVVELPVTAADLDEAASSVRNIGAVDLEPEDEPVVEAATVAAEEVEKPVADIGSQEPDLSEAARRFQTAVEYVLRPESEPAPDKKRRPGRG